ncbi:hypothetical protein [Clostridium magnum]|uniref:Uncharacterized protein n=1 Tax=Clostridium magnum DSM 2767 TaxID=1121326 RepID=A0A161X772_9CLOT|nr:hypothetical protein [Clostridium magnum]KZL89956.1 hypothetical protein CLMAG_44400 [Clostridium magnum DSM 2767]SHJ33071.1 hypothetical protein SAMN02745944_05772 [Clostridium magnum DSM 2767]
MFCDYGFEYYFKDILFVSRDVAEWIEHSQVSRMMEVVDDVEKTTHTTSMNGNCKPEACFLAEDGLYL